MTGDPKKKNRRRTIRHRARLSTKVTATIGALGLGRNVAHSLCDVSEVGACLVVQSELPIGKELVIELSGIQLPRPLKTEGKVIWCEQLEEHVFKVGISFDKPLRYGDMQRL